jgi:hypothetical protein
MALNVKPLVLGVVKASLLFGIVAGGFWVVTHRQDVMDWWQLQQYKPTVDVVAIADSTNMVGRGRDMFYVSDPKIEDSEAFNLHCNDVGEQGSVLGCYTPTRKIYLYNVTDNRLPHVKEVTAAHEMLHAVYDRFDATTKQRIDLLVQDAADKLKGDAALQETIKLYNQSEPGEVPNELHSILGTEYSNLSPELEAHYKQYFSNRDTVVGFAKAYKSIFEASKARIADYDAQLAAIKQNIEAKEAQLTAKRAELDSESARLDALRTSNTAAYNQQVPGYNSKVRNFNTLAREYNDVVKAFNALVVTRNQEAAAQSDLYHSLDSKYQPVSAN